MKVLFTTPHANNETGGLATFTNNIEKTLTNLGLNFDTFCWKNLKSFKSIDISPYQKIINIQLYGGYFLKNSQGLPHITFYHGSELFFKSKNPIKKIHKMLVKKNVLKFICQNNFNVFISQFTMDVAKKNGLKVDYSRDIIFHNCIDTQDAKIMMPPFDNSLRLCCIARNVYHKNFGEVIKFCEMLARQFSVDIELFITANNLYSKTITIHNIEGLADPKREEVFKTSHFNILCSIQDWRGGFVEGFGLTVLEAGKYGTPTLAIKQGGLNESVHHQTNGLFIGKDRPNDCETLAPYLENENFYQQLRQSTYEHTLASHNLALYRPLLEKIL